MPTFCLQQNECLAGGGGCEGYETKRKQLASARAAYRRACEERMRSLTPAEEDDIRDAAERSRRIDEPTDEEQIVDRLNVLIHGAEYVEHCTGRVLDTPKDKYEELAKLLKWHITGSEF